MGSLVWLFQYRSTALWTITIYKALWAVHVFVGAEILAWAKEYDWRNNRNVFLLFFIGIESLVFFLSLNSLHVTGGCGAGLGVLILSPIFFIFILCFDGIGILLASFLVRKEHKPVLLYALGLLLPLLVSLSDYHNVATQVGKKCNEVGEQNCYNIIPHQAYLTGNYQLCERVKNSRESCYNYVARWTGDPTVCNMITSDIARSHCLTQIGIYPR